MGNLTMKVCILVQYYFDKLDTMIQQKILNNYEVYLKYFLIELATRKIQLANKF